MARFWLILILTLPVCGAQRLLQFSAAKEGQSLPGFRASMTGEGRPGEWKIIEAEVPPVIPFNTEKAEIPRQNVLAQVSRDPTDSRFLLNILDDQEFADFTLTTRFKLVAGIVEQMAGIAFRMQNESNYFYIRASGLFNTIKFIPVVNGEIRQPVGSEIPIAKGVWHDLKIAAEGNQIRCWLDGKEAFPALSDPTYNSGKIAFWTKSDSVSYFADTLIDYKPRETLASIFVRELKERHPRLISLRIITAQTNSAPKVIASTRPDEIGQPPNQYEQDVLQNNKKYVGRDKEKKIIITTLPLHDKNGDVAAAVRFEMEPFLGQTDKNALERSGPMIKEMENRLAANRELTGLE